MENKTKIAVSIDKTIDGKMDEESINKSKLINKLLADFLKDEKKVKNFKNKVG